MTLNAKPPRLVTTAVRKDVRLTSSNSPPNNLNLIGAQAPETVAVLAAASEVSP